MNNRRDFLRLSGLAGAAALLPWNKLLASANEVATCTLTPNETEGPFPYPGGELSNPLQIIDITGGQTGVPINYTFTVIDADSCNPLPNIRVDMWHCNKDGDYSGYGNFTGQYWLRGWQVTDANGQVQFTSIYPGWYPGRAVHLHIDIFASNVLVKTTQIAFEEAISDVVHVSPLYAASGVNPTTNMEDGVFGNSAVDLANEMAVVTGNVTDGYAATFTFGLIGVTGTDTPANVSGTISVYPTPVSDKFIVSHPAADANTIVKVMNMEGKVMATGTLKAGATSTIMDVSALANGTYILVVENKGGNQVIKFVKI